MNPFTRLFMGVLLRAKLSRHAPPVGSPSDGALPLPQDRIKIGAVQWNAEPVRRVDEWTRRVEDLFREASRVHCHLLVFPEYLPLSLLGALMPDGTGAHTLTDATIQSVLRTTAPALQRFWLKWMSALSRQHHLVTVAGSGLMVRHGRLQNVAVIFDKDGQIIGQQPKLHVLPDETRWGIAAGDTLSQPSLPPWGVTSIVCNDATYFETFRMAAAQGARIIAVPIADPEARYTVGKARRGCFSQVQDVPMVGVVSAATGRLFGLRLSGKAGIYLPAELTPDGSGVLAESDLPIGEGLVSAVVSLNQLAAFQAERVARHPLPPEDFLQALYHVEEDR
ncbi:MAG: hypothetical protein M1272_06170 [Firmicutes bacterium]|nr:hypothetical protein [Bacillota bacterium]